MADYSNWPTDALEEVHRKNQEIFRLRAALTDAKEAVQSWGAYADAYFQQKWDLAGDIKAIDAEEKDRRSSYSHPWGEPADD